MHILYIHQHFALPSGSTGTRSYEFARRWVKAGHDVTVITGYYDIGGLDCTQKTQTIEGIKVVIAGTKYGNKMSFLKRVFAFVIFLFAAIFKGLKVKNVDIIYATSTPLTIGIPAMVLKWLKRKPFVFEVRDQWPEIPIELGIIKNPILKKVLFLMEKVIYKSSAAIVALSPGMASGVKSIIGDTKHVEIIPNSSDVEVFHPEVDGTEIRKKHSWEDKFLLLHFGAMGAANGLEFIVDAADRLKENKNFHFVIIGDGSTRQSLIDKVKSLGLENIDIPGPRSKTILPQYVAACDVSMVVFADYPILEHNSANKFFDSISAGKPILLNYSGWQRKIIEENNAGFGCDQYNLDQFVDKILYYESHRNQLQNFGANARKLAIERFNRNKLADQVLCLLEKSLT